MGRKGEEKADENLGGGRKGREGSEREGKVNKAK